MDKKEFKRLVTRYLSNVVKQKNQKRVQLSYGEVYDDDEMAKDYPYRLRF